MTDQIEAKKINEITVNIRNLVKGVKQNRKASGAVKKLKKFIQKQWRTKNPVFITEDVNNKIFKRGNNHSIGRIRIRVEKGYSLKDPQQACLYISLVDVNTFKKLNDVVVTE